MSQTTGGTRGELKALLTAVTDARAQVAIERGSGSDAARSRARLQLLRALEEYADALAVRGAPLPHQLRTELNIYRLLDRCR